MWDERDGRRETGNGTAGTGNREPGTGNREPGTGNREPTKRCHSERSEESLASRQSGRPFHAESKNSSPVGSE